MSRNTIQVTFRCEVKSLNLKIFTLPCVEKDEFGEDQYAIDIAPSRLGVLDCTISDYIFRLHKLTKHREIPEAIYEKLEFKFDWRLIINALQRAMDELYHSNNSEWRKLSHRLQELYGLE